MTHTEAFALSQMATTGHEKQALMGAAFRGLGRGAAGAMAGGRFMGQLPGAIARGGGRFGRWAGALPGRAAQEFRAGYGGAPVFRRTPQTPITAAPATAAPASATGAPTGGGPPPGGGAGGGGSASSGGFGGGTRRPRGFGENIFRNVGARVNAIPNERLRGFLTGNSQNLADVGRRTTAIGVPAAYGGWMAAEAPGKARNNEIARWQGEHPILALLARTFGGMPAAQQRSYFLPNVAQ